MQPPADEGRLYGGPNGYGHRPDPEGHARTNVRVMFARTGIDHTTTPMAASNRACGPGVFDQGPTSACTGHAVVGAAVTTLAKAGTPVPVGSPDWTYKVGRMLACHPDPDGTRPPLEDTGAQPNEVMRGVSEFGISRMGPRPPDGRYSDADPTTINNPPALGVAEQASELELTGQYEIFVWDPQFVDLVRAAIAAGYCICFAFFVDTVGPRSVERWDPSTGPLSATVTPRDDKGGPHYVYADGYRTLPNGATVVEWVNSWGVGWGLEGYGEGDEAFMRGWSSVVVMKVRRVAPVAPPVLEAA